MMHFVVAHAQQLGWLIAAYCLLAGIVNVKWPRPAAPRWLSVLHLVLIDWPALFNAKNAAAKGIVLHVFGLPVSVPFLSITQLLEGPPAAAVAKALLPLVFIAFGVSGCAPVGSELWARRSVVTLYTAVGVGTVAQFTCDATARAQAQAGNDDAAAATAGKCGKILSCLHATSDATAGMNKAIDAAKQLGAKNFSSAVTPGLAAACDLNHAVLDEDPKVPIVVPGCSTTGVQ